MTLFNLFSREQVFLSRLGFSGHEEQIACTVNTCIYFGDACRFFFPQCKVLCIVDILSKA